MSLELIPAYNRAEEILSLFTEYTRMLVSHDPSFQIYLDIQHYADEIRDLQAKYGQPDGRLYLALWEGEVAGCIALRKLDEQRCEMKRLYVRPAFRGHRIGDALIDRIIRDAKAIGYRYMLLDTLPFLESAIHMYRKRGFYEIPCYNDSPVETTIFMQYDL